MGKSKSKQRKIITDLGDLRFWFFNLFHSKGQELEANFSDEELGNFTPVFSQVMLEKCLILRKRKRRQYLINI